MHLLFPLAVLYSKPAYAILIISAIWFFSLFFYRRFLVFKKTVLSIILTLYVLATFALIGPLFYSGDLMANVEATKFFAFTMSFWIGYQTQVNHRGLRLSAAMMMMPIFLFYVTGIAGKYDGGNYQNNFMYPPDNNNSAVIFVFFGFFVMNEQGWRRKISYMVLFFYFAILVHSRSLMAMTMLFFSAYMKKINIYTVVLFSIILIVFIYTVVNFFEFNTFSDRLRLSIWKFSYDYATTPSLRLLAPGEATFGQGLANFEFYRSLVVQHAHNIFLHVWASYGVLCFLLLVIFFAQLIFISRKLRDMMLTFQIVSLLFISIFESIITDSRVFCVILFYIGMRVRYRLHLCVDR